MEKMRGMKTLKAERGTDGFYGARNTIGKNGAAELSLKV